MSKRHMLPVEREQVYRQYVDEQLPMKALAERWGRSMKTIADVIKNQRAKEKRND